MGKTLFQDENFREGFLVAAQIVASRIIRTINQHPGWMLPPARSQAVAYIKLTTRYALEKRKIIPTTNQVMKGLAKDIPLSFDLDD